MSEVIPFKVFMSSGYLVDGGLTFFAGTGVVLLGMVALERLGVKINETAVRWFVRGSILVFMVWWVLTSPFLRHLVFGF